jgi:hypothetical protein
LGTVILAFLLKRKADEHATAIATLLTCIWKTSRNEASNITETVT